MAKVLKTAKENPDLWRIEVTCTGKGWCQEKLHPCYCLIEVTALDVRKRSHDGDQYYGFVCPECGCFTELNENQIPSFIKSNARIYSDEEVKSILNKD